MPDKMISQMGDERGNIKNLLSGKAVYDPAIATGGGEGRDITPNEDSNYVGGTKKPHVLGGTAGYEGVPKVGQPVVPYPDVNANLFAYEKVSGLTGHDLHPVLEVPGNARVVGNQVSGMPRDGSFSGPARVGAGNMISDFVPQHGGPEDVEVAPLVGNLPSGMPTAGKSARGTPAEIGPDGLVTGDPVGGYAPGIGKDTVGTPSNKPSNDRGVAGKA